MNVADSDPDTDPNPELGLRIDHKNRAVLWVRDGPPGAYLRINADALADIEQWR
jgi:hypothetical protein